RPRRVREDPEAAAQALHARRRDDARGHAVGAAARPVRHRAPPRVLRAGGAAADRRAERARAGGGDRAGRRADDRRAQPRDAAHREPAAAAGPRLRRRGRRSAAPRRRRRAGTRPARPRVPSHDRFAVRRRPGGDQRDRRDADRRRRDAGRRRRAVPAQDRARAAHGERPQDDARRAPPPRAPGSRGRPAEAAVIRALFLKAAGAATVAVGGLDVWDPARPQIRVLVSPDVRGAMPQVAPDGTFAFGGKRWRGAPSTVRLPSGTMGLVTTLDVDAYLQGVVPLEAPPSWPAAALEAQAIVARTFALGRVTLSRPWDVRADDSDQRWGGVEVETPSTSAAVAATRGRTLTYGGGPAAVFYSACCGGHTADIAAVWNGTPLPYLRGVPDPYCAAAPGYRWERDVALERASEAFRARLGGPLRGTALGAPDDTGRPHSVLLLGATVA